MSSSSHISWLSASAEGSLLAALSALSLTMDELPSQEWDPDTSMIGGIRDIELSAISLRDAEWSFLLLPLNSEAASPLAEELSRRTERPTAAFHEFDQCAWGSEVFVRGNLQARFWNHPAAVELEPGECLVSPGLVGQPFSVGEETVVPYLGHITWDTPSKKANDDAFALDSHWVCCDFMARLGMSYPDTMAPPHVRHGYIREG